MILIIQNRLDDHDHESAPAAARPDPLAARGLPHRSSPGRGQAVAAVPRVSGSRLSRVGRLHGSRQLGHRHRRRIEVRLHAPQRHPHLQPDGHPAAVALRAARRGDRTRPRAGVPRLLLEAGVDRVVDPVRDRDRRVRSRGAARQRARAQPAVRHSDGDRRLPDDARRAVAAVAAEQGLPLHGGDRRHARGDDCASVSARRC